MTKIFFSTCIMFFCLLGSATKIVAQCNAGAAFTTNEVSGVGCLLNATGFTPGVSVIFTQIAPTAATLGSATANSSGQALLVLSGTCPTIAVIYQASGGSCVLSFSNSVAPIKTGSLALTKLTGSNKISWTMQNEKIGTKYELYKSTDGLAFTATNNTIVSSSLTSTANYALTDVDASRLVYYKILVKEISGLQSFTTVLKASNSAAVAISTSYPNPVKSVFTLSVSNDYINGQYKLISTSGSTVLTGKITNNLSQINIDNLAKGLYNVVISNANVNVQNLKLIKQ